MCEEAQRTNDKIKEGSIWVFKGNTVLKTCGCVCTRVYMHTYMHVCV